MAQIGTFGTHCPGLSENVATNLLAVKTNWQQLEKLSKLIGTNRDNHALRDEIQTLLAQTNAKIITIDLDINRMRVNIQNDDKLERRRLSRRAGDFKDILEKYSQCRTAIGSKLKQITLAKVHLEAEDAEPEEPTKQQTMVVDTTGLEIAVLEERGKKVLQLETDILDLNAIMREMAAMAEEQGEQIETIDKNVEASVRHVEEGTTKLQHTVRFANQRRKWFFSFIIGVILLVLLVSLLAK